MTQNKSKWQTKLQNNHLGKRLLMGFILFIALLFMIHVRETPIEMVELNTRAQKAILSPVEFSFPDEEETQILRQESIRDIEKIYKIQPEQIEKKYQQFESNLLNNRSWRDLLPDTTFEELSSSGNALYTELLKARFGNRRTLQRLDRLDLSKKNLFLLPSSLTHTRIPEPFWEKMYLAIQKNASSSSKEASSYVLAYFQETLWSFQIDPYQQKQLRKEIEKKFPEQYQVVLPGQEIISQGELITPKQLTILKAMRDALRKKKIFNPLTLLASMTVSLLIVVVSGCYFVVTQRKFIQSVKKLSLYTMVVLVTFFIAKGTNYLLVHNVSPSFSDIHYLLFVPFAAILLCVLLNFEIAFFTSSFLSIILGFSLLVNPTRFIAANLLGSLVAILASRSLRKRKEVFIICGKVWLSVIPLFFVYNFVKNIWWDFSILSDFLVTLGCLTLTAILVVGLLPIFESIFRIMTDITIMEYMDPNSDLLRRLSLEAPGTYQHCLVVGSIAEAAAQAIGANGLLCRVSTLYHDIGKLSNPHYFTENQMGGFNIHQLLTPLESTQVIIAHIADGEALARKQGLPESFIDIIREHHGTTLVYYFYCKQVEQCNGDATQVDEKQFRYPGPKPQSKEAAIIMMSDTVEAASRSLEQINEQSLAELVDRLIGEKLRDGQFDECALTFKEFGTIKQTIVKMLSVARHLRVKYPTKT